MAGKVGPGPLKERAAIAAVLPQGVSFDSPVIPDVLYGESSQTVEDALATLRAYVRGQTIHDGGLEREIRFERGGKGSREDESQKRQQKSKVPHTVIMLAN